MLSKDYRYYRLDGTGRLHEPAKFAADSDEDAVAQIETKHPDSKCEIWHGNRLVATTSPVRRSA